MYESYYHLSANPFRLTPDPQFCYSHSGYQEAHAYLQYAFELGEGFILLTGRPGAGKTTLVESFLQALARQGVVAARIAVTDFDAADLLRAVAYQFDIPAEGLDKATLVRTIQKYFSAKVQAGHQVLLVIDEAQRLSHASLEELRMLADMQVGVKPLLQIFLVGQESLRSLMREPDMEQLQQRVVGTCRLKSLDVMETRAYVEHRLCRANWRGDPELSGGAVFAVYEYSKGVPRHINKLCTRLLLQGYMDNKHHLNQDDVHRIASELGEEQLAPLALVEKADATTGLAAPDGGLPDLSALALRGEPLADEEQTSPAAVEAEGPRQRRTVDPGDSAPIDQAVTAPAAPANRSTAAHPGGQVRRPGGALAPARTSSGQPAAAVQTSASARARADAPVPGAAQQSSRIARQPWRTAGGAAATGRARPLMADRFSSLVGNAGLLKEKPALLFGLVAAVTLSAGAVTTLVQGVDDMHKLDAAVTQRDAELPAAAAAAVRARAADAQSQLSATISAVAGTAAGARGPNPAGGPDGMPAPAPAQAGPGKPSPMATSPVDRAAAPTHSDPGPMASAATTDRAPPRNETETLPSVDRSIGASVSASGNGTVAIAPPTVQQHSPSAASITAPADRPAATETASAKTATTETATAKTAAAETATAETATAETKAPETKVASTAAATPRSVTGTADPRSYTDTPTTAAAVAPGAEARRAAAVASLDVREQPASADAGAMQRQIDKLLGNAAEALAATRLTIPTGNNAYYYYQRVLRLDPDNAAARRGLDRVVSRYGSLAANAISRGDIDKANRYIARGLRVRPGDLRLVALRDNLKVVALQPADDPYAVPEALPPPQMESAIGGNNFVQRIKAFFAEGADAPQP